MTIKKTNNKLKSTKTAKAVLPLFALFGGQGFASSRNPLSLQSSRKLAGKSVVYINDTPSPLLPIIPVKIQKQSKSPFEAFTNTKVTQINSAEIMVNSKSFNFLKENKLLSSDNSIKSKISGNTQSRKTFADDWQWSTRLPNPLITNSDSSVCAVGASISGFPLSSMVWSYSFFYSNYYCLAYGLGLFEYASATNPSSILAQCQAMHMACDQQPLPVELMKFEVN
jgi:hypothetical protein